MFAAHVTVLTLGVQGRLSPLPDSVIGSAWGIPAGRVRAGARTGGGEPRAGGRVGPRRRIAQGRREHHDLHLGTDRTVQRRQCVGAPAIWANLHQWRATGDARSRPAVGALVGLSYVAVMEGDLTQARGLLTQALGAQRAARIRGSVGLYAGGVRDPRHGGEPTGTSRSPGRRRDRAARFAAPSDLARGACRARHACQLPDMYALAGANARAASRDTSDEVVTCATSAHAAPSRKADSTR